jgi:nucleoside-diphosphate-sugar epimerase
MRILVTGAAGFIGSHLSEALLNEGHEVVGLDAFVETYPRAQKEANLAAAIEHPRFAFHEADLRFADLEPLIDGIDAVVNEAAMAGLVKSWRDIDAYATNNVSGLGRLLEASRNVGVQRFVQISTSSVYGTEAVGDEDRPLRPVSPYGVTKLAAEHLVRCYAEAYGLPAVVLRYFSIYGPRQRPDMAYHIFIEALLNGQPIVVYGDGEQSRSNTYIADCVAGTMRALESAAIGETYNIGGGREITLNEALEILADEVGATPRIERREARTGDQRRTSADIGRAREGFGYEPSVDPKEGLRRQVAWHRSRR